MPSQFSIIFLLVLLVTLVLSSPIDTKIHKRSFKLSRRANPSFTGRNGPRSLVQAYSKHRLPFTDDFVRGAHRASSAKESTTKLENTDSADSGLVLATPVEPNDLEYIAPISIGGQEIAMNFDTGSADLWVFNTQLSAAEQKGHRLYNPAKSSTFSLIPGASFNITYGDGSGATGNVGLDIVSIGGVTVSNQAVELATEVSKSFIRDTNTNGLVGLAFSKLNTVLPQRQKTFFENVLANLAEPVFTADLRMDEVGAYEFGRIDESRFQGPLSWASVDSGTGHWLFESTGFKVGKGGRTAATPGGSAIADTGTTLMLVGSSVINEYYGKVDGAVMNITRGGVTFPCDSDLPDLYVDVGGNMAKVEGRFINFAQVDEITCFGGLQPSGSDLQIYGDVFFKSQFVVFNAGNASIGVAPHVEPINAKADVKKMVKRWLGW